MEGRESLHSLPLAEKGIPLAGAVVSLIMEWKGFGNFRKGFPPPPGAPREQNRMSEFR